MHDRGWLFDLDGTLIDTVDLHADAFVRAFAELGRWVPCAVVRDRIGKGGDRLVAELAPDLTRSESEAVRERQGELVRNMARERGVRVHDGARELIDAVRRRGLRTAVATASRQEDLEAMLEAAGLSLAVDTIVSAAQVERSKPAPDAVHAALDALGVAPGRCLLLGDTAWDVETGRRAGVRVLGVAQGPHDMRRLLGAGAVRVWRDLHGVRADLDATLEACFGEGAQGVPTR